MRYFLRSVKYLVKLAVLLGVVFGLMQLSGTSALEVEGGVAGFFTSFFGSSRGQIFTVALLVWCAVYPAVEFKRRHLFYDLGERGDAIVRAFNAGGMTRVEADDRKMVFAGSAVRRVWWLGEDRVTVTRAPEGGIEIEGPRKFVMEAEHRIPAYIERDENEATR